MYHVRVVATGSGAKAVQVIRYVRRKRVVVHHVGSARDDAEVDALRLAAQEWITQQTHQLAAFPDATLDNVLLLNQCEYLGVYYTFLLDIVNGVQERIGYTNLDTCSLLNDLVTMRVMEPASKLRSIELLETYFGLRHRRQRFYEAAPRWLSLKQEVEKRTLRFAEEEFQFDYRLLFYDVTTLYFETFEADELRKPGFSKENKSNQPQILVALLVTPEGFPVAYEVFAGNTFEGNTLIPVIESFIKKHQVKNFTVVADAAMISSDNVLALKKAGIHYIVGARLGNLSQETFKQMDQRLVRQDGQLTRLNTDNGFLICSFSQTRFRKDKHEMDKQIARAHLSIQQPSQNRKTKFVKTQQQKLELNEELIAKTTKLLGVKGYYTDLPEHQASSQTIIERYHDLYKIEQAFRISKHDLQTRPVFHFKEEPIRLHILICFMALAASKFIELKTNTSLRAFLTQCKKITDARLLNKLTGKVITLRTSIPNNLTNLITKLGLPH
jgi:hypothetical protein